MIRHAIHIEEEFQSTPLRERRPTPIRRMIVFIDETWTTTNMARKNGRAPKGERLRAGVPHGQSQKS